MIGRQTKFTCTTDEVRTWVQGLRTLATPVTSLAVEYPDCLGCGRPLGEDYPVMSVDDSARTVTFTSCGCVLQVEGPWDELTS